MRRLLLIFFAVVVLSGMLGGCGQESAVAPPKAAAPAAKAKPPATQVAPPAAATEEPMPADAHFVYQVEGRRDPFVPLVATKKTMGDISNPLEAFDLPQFVVKGVIIGMGDPKVMVSAPDGKTYILKKGMRIGKSSGIVKEINRQKVLIEEQYRDLNGKIRFSIQELIVPRQEGV